MVNIFPILCIVSQQPDSFYCVEEGQVRLTNGYSGLLEVYFDGEWGYVCDNGWTEVNGDVVCSILGYDGATSSSGSHFSSDVNYKLNFINCVGEEEDLLDCPYRLYTPNSCSISVHVTISCVPGKIYVCTSIIVVCDVGLGKYRGNFST